LDRIFFAAEALQFDGFCLTQIVLKNQKSLVAAGSNKIRFAWVVNCPMLPRHFRRRGVICFQKVHPDATEFEIWPPLIIAVRAASFSFLFSPPVEQNLSKM
jgi:hypothetical protein